MPDGFEIRAFQGKGTVFPVELRVGSFAGTEPLMATIGAGDTSSPALAVMPTWIAPTPPATAYTAVALPFTASDLAALAPGPYSVLISLADSTAPLARGFLEVYAAPGGLARPYYRSLTTPAFAEEFLPDLTREQADMLPLALAGATRTIETFVGRGLVLDAYDHFARPVNSTKLRLRTRPVVEVFRVAVDTIAGLVLSNGTSGASSATVQTVTTGPNSLQIKNLAFALTVSGATTTQPLVMASYPTFGALAAAIVALGNGWGASTQVPGLAVADAFGSPGVRGVLRENPWIHTHSQRLGWVWGDPDRGVIELDEPIPGGTLIRRRADRSDSRDTAVRVTYRAGYATDPADVALGYYPVPEDLQVACTMTAKAIIEHLPQLGPVMSQTVKDRSYTLQQNPLLIPLSVQQILQSYQDFVC